MRNLEQWKQFTAETEDEARRIAVADARAGVDERPWDLDLLLTNAITELAGEGLGTEVRTAFRDRITAVYRATRHQETMQLTFGPLARMLAGIEDGFERATAMRWLLGLIDDETARLGLPESVRLEVRRHLVGMHSEALVGPAGTDPEALERLLQNSRSET